MAIESPELVDVAKPDVMMAAVGLPVASSSALPALVADVAVCERLSGPGALELMIVACVVASPVLEASVSMAWVVFLVEAVVDLAAPFFVASGWTDGIFPPVVLGVVNEVARIVVGSCWTRLKRLAVDAEGAFDNKTEVTSVTAIVAVSRVDPAERIEAGGCSTGTIYTADVFEAVAEVTT